MNFQYQSIRWTDLIEVKNYFFSSFKWLCQVPAYLLLWSVRVIARNGYVVTSWEMAIWPPKLDALYKVPSKLFSGLKSGLFPQGFAYNTIKQWSFSSVRKKWRKKWLAKRFRVSKRKPHCVVLILLWFLHDKTPNRWKLQVRCNFFPLWKRYVIKRYVINVNAFFWWYFCIGPRLRRLVQGFWRWNTLPCSFATCVCNWPFARSMLWTWFQAVFTLFPDRQWKSSSISSRNKVNCVVKI